MPTKDSNTTKPTDHHTQPDKVNVLENNTKSTTNSTPHKSSHQDVKTSKHATRYLFVGIGVTLFNYALFTVLSNFIINNNSLLWFSNLIATSITTIVAYIAHSNVTWKERSVTKAAICRFFIWNALLAIAIGPWLVQLFSLLTPIYELAYNLSQTLHFPFSYEFILTTGSFALTSIITMILNFLFYDRFVFGKQKI